MLNLVILYHYFTEFPLIFKECKSPDIDIQIISKLLSIIFVLFLKMTLKNISHGQENFIWIREEYGGVRARKVSKYFFTYIHVDLFCSHSSIYSYNIIFCFSFYKTPITCGNSLIKWLSYIQNKNIMFWNKNCNSQRNN